MSDHPRVRFPAHGRTWPELADEMQARNAGNADWRGGRTAIFFFLADEEAYRVGKQAYMTFFSENALGATRAYPGIAAMEREVLDYGMDLLSAPDGARGVFTTGGTESIFLAVRAARERFRALRTPAPGTRLNLVMPVSGHPAFDKSADVMDLEIRRAPLGPDLRVDVDAMRALIDDNTMLLVGSAPCFPHGVIDPIEAISEVAQGADVWMHVDGCVGGWVAPFFARVGRGTPAFDFRFPGVRSISADLHKFGFAPKPSSTVFLRDPQDLDRATFRFGSWGSGTYTTATMCGTRPGAAVAAAWAVLNHLGMEGYERLARRLGEMVDAYVAGLTAIDGIELWAKPDVTILNFGSRSFDIYAVAELMRARQWVPGLTSQPRGMHTMLAMQHAPVRDQYLADLAESVALVRARGTTSDQSAVYS